MKFIERTNILLLSCPLDGGAYETTSDDFSNYHEDGSPRDDYLNGCMVIPKGIVVTIVLSLFALFGLGYILSKKVKKNA